MISFPMNYCLGLEGGRTCGSKVITFNCVDSFKSLFLNSPIPLNVYTFIYHKTKVERILNENYCGGHLGRLVEYIYCTWL